MISEGDIVIFRFPKTDLGTGKLRPALLLKKIPNEFHDWLVCMITTQLHQQIKRFEVIIAETDEGFQGTGLKQSSLIRISRLAVVDKSVFEGKLGVLPPDVFTECRQLFSSWLNNSGHEQ